MTQPLTFVVLSTGLDTFKEIRAALATDSRARLLAGGDDAEQVYPEIKNLRPSAVVITIADANAEHALKIIEKLSVECPQIAIISAARESSPDLILRSMRAGAREFLRLPVIADEFKTVLDRTAEFCAGQKAAPKKKGRMIAVFSSKGGCGTSFIATNLAASLNAPAVLVDLNLQAGDLPLFLGLEPKYSIADMVENRVRMDDSLLASYITPHSSNLSLLAAPREADSADDIEPEHVFEALERLRESYDYVVLDPQHTFDAITLAALDQSDDIVLVLTLDIPAIRSAQRALEIFDRLGYPRKKVRIVVNRFSKQIDLDLQQVERFLKERVTGFVASDYQTAVTSINLGQPLVQSEPSSKIALELKRITATIIGQSAQATEEQPQRRKIWSGLFKRSSNNAQQQLDLRATLEKV
ncbi:MAG: pilus assembly protein CpaE [Acidobacteriota bacterium]|jgi:pilus assembly protein CpaE|nr:pilus assembly protein CpaE [Acidobacteriota bacterium]